MGEGHGEGVKVYRHLVVGWDVRLKESGKHNDIVVWTLTY